MFKNKKIYYINSRNRLNGTNSNFQYSIPLPDNSQFTHCAVLQASIPKSYYLVPNNQNTFTISENKVNTTITIPPGSYSRRSFLQQLNTAMNTGTTYTYTITTPNTATGNAETGLFYFAVAGNAGVQPNLIIGNYLWEMLGFDRNTTYSFVADALVSVNVCKLQKEDTLQIHSDMCHNEGDNILQEIYASDSTDFAHITFINHNVDYYAKKLNTEDNTYRFWITNEDGEEMDLKGNNWVMSIVMFQIDNINEIIKQYIKFRLIK